MPIRSLHRLVLVLIAAVAMVACEPTITGLPTDATIDVGDVTVVYDGASPALDISIEPAEAATAATIVVTPEGGEPLEAGEIPVDVGTYQISITLRGEFEGSATGTLIITPRPITIVPAAGQSKLVGQDDPALDYGVENLPEGFAAADVLSGALGRDVGETVGSYDFSLGTLDAGANYEMSLDAEAPAFQIAVGSATITIDSATVVFDGTERALDIVFDPVEAATGATIQYGQLDAGSFPTDAGEYEVQVDAGAGYLGSATATLTIDPRPLDVLPAAEQSRQYGEADSALAYDFVDDAPDGPVLPDPADVTGTIGRATGTGVGTYAYTVGDLDAGSNYVLALTSAGRSFAITGRPLTLTGFRVENKVYDGTTSPSGATFDDDRVEGDDLAFSFDVAFASTDVGDPIDVAFTNLVISGGADAGNYALQTTSGATTATITPRGLAVTDVLWADKTYDGGTGATASATLVTSIVVPGDDVGLVTQLVGEFEASSVGSHDVSGAFALQGADASNYAVAPQPTGTATINARPVEVTQIVVDDKPYDATTDASVQGTLQSATGFDRGVLASDVGSLTLLGTFASADAAADIAVTLSVSGTNASNYTLDYGPLQATITPRPIDVVPSEGQSKVYGESDPSFAYALADPGAGEVLPTVDGALTREPGEDASTYAFTIDSLTTSANFALELIGSAPTFKIELRPITLSTTESAWTYGDTTLDLTAVVVTPQAGPAGLRSGDVLSGALATIERPTVADSGSPFLRGTADINGDPNGAGSASVWSNYAVAFSAYTVELRPLLIKPHDQSKTYGDVLDLGTLAFAFTDTSDPESGPAYDEAVAQVTLASVGAAAGASVIDGPTYDISASEPQGVNGFDPANYDIAYEPGTLTVEVRDVTIGGSFVPAAKPYDGTTAATLETNGLTLLNTVDGDDVTLAPAAVFDDVTVATGKTVTLTGDTTLEGADAGNYLLSMTGAPSSSDGEIVKRDITFDVANKNDLVYDGSRALPITISAANLPAADTNPVAYTMLRRYVVDAEGDPVSSTVSALDRAGTYVITISSIDGRYTGSDSIEVPVAHRPIAVASQTAQKIYGARDPLLAAMLSGDASFGRDDVFDDRGLLSYAGSDVGVYELSQGTVGILRSGTGEDMTANYAFTTFGTFEITARPLTITASDRSKTYGDALTVGTTDFTVAVPTGGEVVDGLVGDETVTAVALASDGAAAEANAGDYPVAPSAATGSTGFDAANYDVTYIDGTLSVAKRALTAVATTDTESKQYGDADPTIQPAVGEGTLPAFDAFSGTLTYAGAGTLQDVGAYALDAGTDFKIVRTADASDVTANYVLAYGDFTIEQKPVDFFIDNADDQIDGTYVIYADGQTEIGLRTASDPAGVTDVLLSYKRTHDAQHQPIDPALQPVGTIVDLGTYEVTMQVFNDNYVDATPGGTVRTLWLTDATQVAFTGVSDASALIGANGTLGLELRGADGQARTAGPVDLTVDLAASGDQITFRDASDTQDLTSVAIASGTSSADVLARADALVPSIDDPLTVTSTAPGGLLGDTTPFSTHASLTLTGGDAWPVAWQVGAGVTSETLTVNLVGANGDPVSAPTGGLAIDLGPTGVTFYDASGQPLQGSVVTIAGGASSADVRLASDTAATYDLSAAHTSTYANVTGGTQALTVSPAPAVTSLDPSTVEKAQTTTVTVSGSGFATGIAASFSGTDVTVDSVTVDSDVQLTLDITLAATTSDGTRSLTLTNVDGGEVMQADAITLTVPTLTAADDGSFGVVEGGTTDLSISTDLLANDSGSNVSGWGFDGVVTTTGVSVTRSGDTLSVSAPTDTGGSTASFTYRIRDAYDRTSTATVSMDRTYAPTQAIVFTNATEFEHFRSAEYSVPTFADVFDSWPRFDGSSYFLQGDSYSTNAGAWRLEGGTIVQPNNAYPPVGFVSPDEFEYFTFEGTVYSGDADDDSIGLIAAFTRTNGSNVSLVAHRTKGGNLPSSGWGLTLVTDSTTTVLAEPDVDAFDTTGGWSGAASRIEVERTGDVIRVQASDWFTTDVATATPAYDGQSLITLNLATGVVSYRSGTTFVEEQLGAGTTNSLAGLRGGAQYGYFTVSQPDSKYYNVLFEGGAALDTAFFLSGYDAATDSYSTSEVWRFTTAWNRDTGATIQSELGYPRTVTSVATPPSGSTGYTSYQDEGLVVEITADTVDVRP